MIFRGTPDLSCYTLPLGNNLTNSHIDVCVMCVFVANLGVKYKILFIAAVMSSCCRCGDSVKENCNFALGYRLTVPLSCDIIIHAFSTLVVLVEH